MAKADPKLSSNKLLQGYKDADNKDAFLKKHTNFAQNHPELGTLPGVKGKITQNLVAGDIAAGQATGTANINQGNATTVTPFGTSEVTFDAQGNPIYTEKMDPTQAGLLEGSQALNQAGTAAANNIVGNLPTDQFANVGEVPDYDPNAAGPIPDYVNTAGELEQFDPSVTNLNEFEPGSPEAIRARVEDAAYSRLTKNVTRDENRELEQAKQSLLNKGIPYSDDPESRYQKELGTIQEKYTGIRQDAMSRAVEMGGQEALLDFNMAKDTFITQEQTQQAQFELEKLTNDQRNAITAKAHEMGITDAEMYAKLQQQAKDQGIADTEMLATLQQTKVDQAVTVGNTKISQAQALSQLGTGAIMPNLPGYQGPPPITATPPSEIRMALKQLGLTDKQIDTQWNIAYMQNSTKLAAIAAESAAAADAAAAADSDGLDD